MKDIDTQDSFSLIQEIEKLSSNVKPRFIKSQSDLSAPRYYDRKHDSNSTTDSFQGPGIIPKRKRSRDDIDSDQMGKVSYYKEYMGQDICQNVSSDIKNIDLRLGKVSKVRKEKNEVVFDITFRDGSMSTLNLYQVNQAIAFYAFKNSSNPE